MTRNGTDLPQHALWDRSSLEPAIPLKAGLVFVDRRRVTILRKVDDQIPRDFEARWIAIFGARAQHCAEFTIQCVRVRVIVSLRTTTKYVIGPDGHPLTIANLPTPGTKRWVTRRKAEVVAAVRGGLLSLEEACRRYKLTVEEFFSWQRSLDEYGLAGLRSTRIQQYRQK